MLQALEKELAAGGALDTYELEGPDRPELVADLAEFQLAAVTGLTCPHRTAPACALGPAPSMCLISHGMRGCDSSGGAAW